MTQAAAPNLANSLVVIHRVITRGLQVAGANATAFAAEGWREGSPQEGFLNYVRSLGAVLHGHHLGEDDLAFPFLRERLPGPPYDRWSAEHRVVTGMLDELAALVRQCDKEAWPEPVRALSELLDRLNLVWQPHYQAEERHLSPETLGPLLSPEEHATWIARLSAYSQKHSKPDSLVVPFILYNLPPATRAVLAAGMPPELTQHLVPVVWKDQWASMQPFLLE